MTTSSSTGNGAFIFSLYRSLISLTGIIMAKAIRLDVSEKINPRQDEGPHPFMARDFQSQEILYLGGDDGESGASHKATEQRF